MATACLKAAANDLSIIRVREITYEVLKHIRYDASYVDKYIDNSNDNLGFGTIGSSNITNKMKVYPHHGSVDAKSDIKDVYVYFKLQSCGCIKQNHKVGTVTLKTHSLTDSKEISINAYHCFDCKRYFVNNDAVKNLLMKHQSPLVNFHVVTDFSSGLNPESELKMYGYSVQENGLSDAQRQKLLSTIIDTKLMSKHRIIKCIQFNIDFIGKRANMDCANEKWKKDIQFVSQYVEGNSRIINGRLVRSK